MLIGIDREAKALNFFILGKSRHLLLLRRRNDCRSRSSHSRKGFLQQRSRSGSGMENMHKERSNGGFRLRDDDLGLKVRWRVWRKQETGLCSSM